MNPPEVHRRGSHLLFVWHEDQIEASVRRIRESGDHIRAEVVWQSTIPDEPSHLHAGVLSLTSSSAKITLAKALAARLPDKDWGRFVEQLACTVVERFRKGEPIVLLSTTGDEPPRIPLAIEPFIYEKLPFVFYGEPGSAKSYLGAFVAALAATASRVSGVPLAAQRAFSPLYLDWESQERELKSRVRRIDGGLSTSLHPRIWYRPCVGPLAQSIDEIAEASAELALDLFVIDSLGQAAGGDLNSPQSAQEFFAALRQLNGTPIIIAHCAKNADPRASSIFGSQFFTAHARGIAQVRRFQDAGDDELHIGIYHRKSNVSKLVKPFGLRVHFDGDEGPVTFHPQDLRSIPKLATTLSTSDRIIDTLLHEGPQKPREVAEALGITKVAARQALGRLRDRKRVVKLDDGRYGAATREEEEDIPF